MPASRAVRMRIVLAAALTAAGLGLAAPGVAAAGPASGSAIQQPQRVPGSIGSVPPAASGPEKSGTITVAEYAAPDWILPIAPDSDYYGATVGLFSWQMWRPVYWTANGVTPEVDQALSLAYPPVYRDGDRTVSITFKNSFSWSDGSPVTADDLLFDIDLIKAAVKKSASDWGPYISGNFPDNLASTATPNTSTLVLHMSGPVNPAYFTEDVLGTLNPLPAQAWDVNSAGGPPITDWASNPADALKILNYLFAQSGSLSSYATNQLWRIVDGPYRLSAFSPGSGAYTMVPNTSYGGPHAATMSTIKGVVFSSYNAALNAIFAGTIDVGYTPDEVPGILSGMGQLGYHYFGEPDFAYSYASYNFKDQTGHFAAIASQLYFRQAMAHLVNQQTWIRTFLDGEAAPDYGPVPVYPASSYLPGNAATDPYPYSIQTAVSLLEGHGWTVTPGGTDMCSDPGDGAGQCGTGIPLGTPLAFNLLYENVWPTSNEITDLAAQARKAGIRIQLQPTAFDNIVDHYSDPLNPGNDSKWAMEDAGYTPDATDPTTFGTFNTGASGNSGDYSNLTANTLINASTSGSDPAAAKSEAAFLTANQPVLFEPNLDDIVAWKTSISGPPASFENLTQYMMTPEFWYFVGS
jgi:peptide/nickel transport system substrate-binding protein